MNEIEQFQEQIKGKYESEYNLLEKSRRSFVGDFPINRIKKLKLEEYALVEKKEDKQASFCYRLLNELASHLNFDGGTSSDMFGIYKVANTKIKLSAYFQKIFRGNTTDSFKYIKIEIVKLLQEVDNRNYSFVEKSNLDANFKRILITTYFPERFLPLGDIAHIDKYCKVVGLRINDAAPAILKEQRLIEWKASNEKTNSWNNYYLLRYVEWLDAIRGTEEEKELIEQIEKEVTLSGLEGDTRETVIKARINQSIFRQKLIERYGCCCLCGISNKNLLVASHIKPWVVADKKEKLDVDNGFLLCSNHDGLFDRGLISFNDDGNIMISDRLSDKDRILLNIDDNKNIYLTPGNKKYLNYHRNNVFQKEC